MNFLQVTDQIERHIHFILNIYIGYEAELKNLFRDQLYHQLSATPAGAKVLRQSLDNLLSEKQKLITEQIINAVASVRFSASAIAENDVKLNTAQSALLESFLQSVSDTCISRINGIMVNNRMRTQEEYRRFSLTVHTEGERVGLANARVAGRERLFTDPLRVVDALGRERRSEELIRLETAHSLRKVFNRIVLFYLSLAGHAEVFLHKRNAEPVEYNLDDIEDEWEVLFHPRTTRLIFPAKVSK